MSLRPPPTPHIFKCLIVWSGTRKGTLLHLAESRGTFKHVDTDQETLSWPSYSTTIEHHTLKYFKIPVSTDSHPLWHVKKFSWLRSWHPEAIFHFSLYLSVQVPRWRKGSFCPEKRRSQRVEGQRSVHSLYTSNHNGVELLTSGRRYLKNNWFALQMFLSIKNFDLHTATKFWQKKKIKKKMLFSSFGRD